jgi:class 3 adenylate cyclase/tetratricopeptide (TPR) repeat protein
MPSERIQRQIDRLLDEAEKAAAEKDWAHVADCAREVLAVDAGNEDAVTFLSMAERQGNLPPHETRKREPSFSDASRPPPLPSSFDAGRYRVKSFLGEGGRKRVYLANDTKLQREVAVAVIKTEGLDEQGLTRVKREALSMARLGNHPHIVTIFDIGDNAGEPYIVSQYMAGGDVAELLEKAPSHQLAIDEAVTLTKQVCEALEHAHSAGIIHRDIKPGNVWLTATGDAKLGDFGLAVALDRSRLTVAGMMIGTVAYMSPEQAVGRQTDARSDLYSLGAMLYEMVTGRPPFLGEDIVSIVSQHINTAPVSPSWHRSDLPRALEALILRLLAKTPEDRPEDASTTLKALAAVSTSTAGPSEAASDANPLDRLAGGIFVGREKELDELRGYLEETLSGHGRTAMLVGEPGIGKTRTSEELTTYARLRSVQVLWGQCYESEAMPAYWPWVQVIRSYVHDRDPATLMSEMGSAAAEIAQVVSDVRERLPGLPVSPSSDPEQARFRLFDGITQFLKNATKAQPMVLVLDDLHWADKSSLLLLQFLAREIRSSRLLVIGTYRDVEVGRQHPLSQTLAELNREHLMQRIVLRGLSEEDIARFVYMTSGVEPPEALVKAVNKETEGNPFFVNEIVRLLVSDGRLEHVTDVSSWSVTIPQSVKEVVGRRLNHLSPDCNRVLTAGAVIGREFDLDILKDVCNIPEDRVLDLLEEADAARVIAEVQGTMGRYVFTHALIRETLSSELSTTRRVRLHRQIAQTLEALHRQKPDAYLAQMAYHYFEGAQSGDVDKAVQFSRLAGDKAMASVAYEEAASHYENALQAIHLTDGGDKTLECDLLLALGDARWKAGEPPASRQTYERAADIARAENLPEKLAAAALGIGGRLATTYSVDAALVVLLEEALAVLPDDRYSLRSRVLSRLAQEVGGSAGRPDPARALELSDEAVLLARKSRDHLALSHALEGRYFVASTPERVQERSALAKELVDVAGNDPELLMHASDLRLMSFFETGQVAQADSEFERLMAEARDLRQHLYIWFLTLYASTRALARGKIAEAEGLAAQALALGQRVQPQTTMQTFGVQLLMIRREQFRLAELEAIIKGNADAVPEVPAYQAVIPLMYKDLGREADARQAFEKLIADDYIAKLPADGFRLVALTLLSEVAAYLGDQKSAQVLYDAVAPFNHQHVTIFPAMGSFGSCSYYLGELAMTLERWDEAERHFEDSLHENAALDSRMRLAHTQCEFARMLLRRDGHGDHARASQLLTDALTTGQETGGKFIVEEALAIKVKLQGLDSASVESSIDTIADSVSQERPDLRSHAAPDGTVTIIFSDIEGSTVLTEKLGDRRWMSLLKEHNQIVRRELRAHHGFEVKSEGDGFMLAFQSAAQALRCAIAIQRDLTARNASAAEQIKVRMGLHTGEVIKEDEDFFGRNVIMAARVASQANGGEILASGVLKALLQGSDVSWGKGRTVALKGLSGEHEIWPVRWGS